jgi:hypothetical protein
MMMRVLDTNVLLLQYKYIVLLFWSQLINEFSLKITNHVFYDSIPKPNVSLLYATDIQLRESTQAQRLQCFH